MDKIMRLICHPDTPASHVRDISVSVAWEKDRHFRVVFRLTGDLERLELPMADEQPQRNDNLWQTTCFEVFAGHAGSEAYTEFNFSPSGNWAAYDFDSYRHDMNEHDCLAPQILCGAWNDELTLEALFVMPEGTDRLALSAVVEEENGQKSYWALALPPGAPDFHHADCFALYVAAGEPL